MNNISNTKQDLSKENSRSRILESALQIFSTKGFEGASVSDIVQAAGVTKPTLYYFFTNKEGLYKAVWKENFDDFLKNLKVASDYKPKQEVYYKDVYPVLCGVVKVFFDFAKTNQVFFFHTLSVFSSPDTVACADVGIDYYQQLYSILHSMFLNMGKAHGGIKGRDFQLTVSFIGMINSYITCWKLKGDGLTKKTIDSMVRQFMHGIFN